MWIKKVFASVWFRGIVAGLTPLLGLIILSSLPIRQINTYNELISLLSLDPQAGYTSYTSQIATYNELIFLVLSLSILLHFLINLVLPFAVNWIKAILVVIPTFIYLLSFLKLPIFVAVLVLMATAMYGSDIAERARTESLLLIFKPFLLICLAAIVSIVFARLGAGLRLGTLLKKNTKS
jgi:hypothetical protein